MKKLFKGKNTGRKAIWEFFEKRGFYIILVLCIAIVGATAVFITTHNVTSSNEEPMEEIIPEVIVEEMDENDVEAGIGVSEDEEMAIGTSLSKINEEIDEEAEITQSTQNDSKTSEQEKSEQKSETSENSMQNEEPKTEQETSEEHSAEETATSSQNLETKDIAAKKDNSKEIPKFIMPVIGDITFDYAMDRLVYSKTLEDWRTHSGVDIGADRGTNVKAVAAGFISEIKNDPRFGITVIIDHGEGLKTVYSNLASDEVVNPNQKIKQGEVIGSVGNTALFESAEQAHLHFEVWENNTPVDPKKYLPLKE